MKYCEKCGAANNDAALFCDNCKEMSRNTNNFWRRVIAIFIDILILSVPIRIYLNLFGTDTSFILGQPLLFYVGMLLYFTSFESSTSQASIGKQALGLKVTDLNGNRISFNQAFVRHLAKLITGVILLVGYITIPFSKKNQGIYDMIAKTLVVRDWVIIFIHQMCNVIQQKFMLDGGYFIWNIRN